MKKILLAIFMMLATVSLSYAQNTIYMRQLGSASNITLEQVGSNNSIGSVTTYSLSNGDTNNITVQQTGSSNIHNFSIIGSTNTYSSIINGDSNQFTLTCGDVMTSCQNADIGETITGNLNTVATK